MEAIKLKLYKFKAYNMLPKKIKPLKIDCRA